MFPSSSQNEQHVHVPLKVFNREELQYETYEMGVWDYWWGDASDEVLEGEEILE